MLLLARESMRLFGPRLWRSLIPEEGLFIYIAIRLGGYLRGDAPSRPPLARVQRSTLDVAGITASAPTGVCCAHKP